MRERFIEILLSFAGGWRNLKWIFAESYLACVCVPMPMPISVSMCATAAVRSYIGTRSVCVTHCCGRRTSDIIKIHFLLFHLKPNAIRVGGGNDGGGAPNIF